MRWSDREEIVQTVEDYRAGRYCQYSEVQKSDVATGVSGSGHAETRRLREAIASRPPRARISEAKTTRKKTRRGRCPLS